MNYINKVNGTIKDYFKVLEPNFPGWLNDYINTKEMLHQQYISITCSTLYTDMINNNTFSSLDHSIAVALIVWHFTHDKKQTLSGLFHDIATPVFKHCIDFLHGDGMRQEYTENLTEDIIANSKEIMKLLDRDNIKIEEVADYHIYSIADNDMPKLSADRLEYSLSNALITYELLDINSIKEIYNDIEVEENEEGIIELGFKTKKIARKFVKITSELSWIYRNHEARFSYQFIADIVKRLFLDGVITEEDLYKYKESEIIDVIDNSKYSDVFNIWKKAKKVNISKEKPVGVYSVNIGSKIRYIDPLVNGKRISTICKIANKMIENNKNKDMDYYLYLDFDF